MRCFCELSLESSRWSPRLSKWWDVDEAMTGLHPSIMLESLSMYYRGLNNFDATPPASGEDQQRPNNSKKRGVRGGGPKKHVK